MATSSALFCYRTVGSIPKEESFAFSAQIQSTYSENENSFKTPVTLFFTSIQIFLEKCKKKVASAETFSPLSLSFLQFGGIPERAYPHGTLSLPSVLRIIQKVRPLSSTSASREGRAAFSARTHFSLAMPRLPRSP